METNLTVNDLQILKDHGIVIRLSITRTLEVLNEWTKNGHSHYEWIPPPFKNTKQLLTWLGY